MAIEWKFTLLLYIFNNVFHFYIKLRNRVEDLRNFMLKELKLFWLPKSIQCLYTSEKNVVNKQISFPMDFIPGMKKYTELS